MAAAQVTYLKEQDIVPTNDEVEAYAEFVGIDLELERDLLHVARDGLLAKLPEGWQACKSTEQPDDVFYWHAASGKSTWDHPMDSVVRQRVVDAREQRFIQAVTLTMSIGDDETDVVATSMAGEEVARVAFTEDDTFADVADKLRQDIAVAAGAVLYFMKKDASLIGHSAGARLAAEVLA